MVFCRLLRFNLLVVAFLSISANACAVFGQAIIYNEDFEQGVYSWTLNATEGNSDPSPDPDNNNYNYWIINNAYQGGDGDAGNCFGFIPIEYTFNNTPLQPLSVSENPQSHYMHMTSIGGPLNAGYLVANELCLGSFNHLTRMTSGVSTIGYTQIEFSFWWIGTGADNSKMQLYYSTDNGANWTLVDNPNGEYFNNSSWQFHTVGLPQFENQQSLMFGFRLRNQDSNQIYPGNIGFGLDNIQLRGLSTSPNLIVLEEISDTILCMGDSLQLSFSASGNYENQNSFIAELSDANGSFLNPLIIGLVNSTNSAVIAAVLPETGLASEQYKVRIRSSNPPGESESFSSDLMIGLRDTIELPLFPDTVSYFCENGSVIILALEGYSEYLWSNGVNSNFIEVNSEGFYSAIARAEGGCILGVSDTLYIFEEGFPSGAISYNQISGTYLVQFSVNTENTSTVSWEYNNTIFGSGFNTEFEFPFDGTYTVRALLGGPCGFDTLQIDVEVIKSLGNAGLLKTSGFSFYPNPASDYLFFEKPKSSQNKNYQILLSDLFGRTLRTYSANELSNQLYLDLTGIPDGNYVLSIVKDYRSDGMFFSVLKR